MDRMKQAAAVRNIRAKLFAQATVASPQEFFEASLRACKLCTARLEDLGIHHASWNLM